MLIQTSPGLQVVVRSQKIKSTDLGIIAKKASKPGRLVGINGSGVGGEERSKRDVTKRKSIHGSTPVRRNQVNVISSLWPVRAASILSLQQDWRC